MLHILLAAAIQIDEDGATDVKIDRPWAITVSRYEKTIAILGADSIEVRSADTLELRVTIPVRASAVSFGSGGQQITVISESAERYDVASGKLLWKHALPRALPAGPGKALWRDASRFVYLADGPAIGEGCVADSDVKVEVTALDLGRVDFKEPLLLRGRSGDWLLMQSDGRSKFGVMSESVGKPIAAFQAIQFKIARMKADILALTAMLHEVIAGIESGRDVRQLVSAGKILAGELGVKGALEAMQVFGGASYLVESEVERAIRDGKLLVIAKELLGEG